MVSKKRGDNAGLGKHTCMYVAFGLYYSLLNNSIFIEILFEFQFNILIRILKIIILSFNCDYIKTLYDIIYVLIFLKNIL